MPRSLEAKYFTWLYAIVCDNDITSQVDKYTEFLAILHSIEFTWLVIGDDNRSEDGHDLRIEFLNTHFLSKDDSFLQTGCTVLEMLVAFSRRASFETDETPQYWFWMMIQNLRLFEVNDLVGPDVTYVHDVIDKFIWRTYDRKGNGGLFPLRRSRNDQRGVEVWYQFNEYLAENGK